MLRVGTEENWRSVGRLVERVLQFLSRAEKAYPVAGDSPAFSGCHVVRSMRSVPSDLCLATELRVVTSLRDHEDVFAQNGG